MVERIFKIIAQIWHFLSDLFAFLQTDPTKNAPKTPKSDSKKDEDSETESKPKTRPNKIPTTTKTETPSVEQGDLSKRKGFKGDFLSVPISLPKLAMDNKVVLPYHHFTVVMNPERRMPYYTAVNIDAVKYNKLKDQIPSRKEMGADDWDYDPRMDKTMQLGKSFYSRNDFDLGHMVRREDPLWGDTLEEALVANDDTFFLTNATPQHKDFNRSAERWKGLEDFALSHARKNSLKLSVFTGCIFSPTDRYLGKVQIPSKYWKVIVMIKKDGTPSATGYIINQDDLIEDITSERQSLFVFQQFKTYQVQIKNIEAQTGIKFGLGQYDPLQKANNKRGLVMDLPVMIEEGEQIEF
jgi:DNA/RNA endonuclease G (NUC1)